MYLCHTAMPLALAAIRKVGGNTADWWRSRWRNL